MSARRTAKRPIASAPKAAGAGLHLTHAASSGDLIPSEAGDLMKIVETYARTLQAADFEARLERLESQSPGR